MPSTFEVDGKQYIAIQSGWGVDAMRMQAGIDRLQGKQTIVPDWVTEDGYTRDLTVRTKVGDAQGSSRVGILTTATGEVEWARASGRGRPRCRRTGDPRGRD